MEDICEWQQVVVNWGGQVHTTLVDKHLVGELWQSMQVGVWWPGDAADKGKVGGFDMFSGRAFLACTRKVVTLR